MATAAPFILRRATAGDQQAIEALVHRALREFDLTPDPAGTDADLRDLSTHYFSKGGDFVVLALNGTVVGTCGLHVQPDGAIELRKMYLAPGVRGQGQGRRLLEWAINRARELGFKRLTLETATVLKDAIALYERRGFVKHCGALHTCRCDAGYTLDL